LNHSLEFKLNLGTICDVRHAVVLEYREVRFRMVTFELFIDVIPYWSRLSF